MFTFVLAVILVAASGPQADSQSTPLAFVELLESSPRALVPTAKLTSLVGHRVTMIGYMAQLETAPRGGFFLVPSPVDGDESGGGTADLPPSAVFVIVPSAAGRSIDTVPGPVRVTGVLELGPREDPDGLLTRIRLHLDRDAVVEVPR